MRGLALLAVVLPGLLSCSGPGPAAVAPQPVIHTVTIEAVAFTPPSITVKAGDSIVWTNKDPFPHSVRSKDGAFDSQPIEADRSWTLTPSSRGELSYICALHPNMTGTIRVE
jgi:plastocyanin